VPDQWSSDEEIIHYALSVHDLISAGKALSTFHSLGSLWKQLGTTPGRTCAMLEVGHAFIDTANQLDRISVSLRVSKEMREIAIATREPAWVATSLWLSSVSSRHLRPRSLDFVEDSFSTFGGYLSDWQPASPEGRAAKQEFAQFFRRDHVLAGLDMLKEQVASESFVNSRIAALQSQASELNTQTEIGLANEVITRALVATGRVDEAIEPLRIAKANVNSRANQLKFRICHIQLLAADGQPQEAQAALEKAVDFADSFHLVHHRHKLATIQLSLMAGKERSFSLPL
jgi:hypothetical protein